MATSTSYEYPLHVAKSKLLFDECVGHPIVDQLRSIIGIDPSAVELEHVIRRGFGGMNDDEWIPMIAGEGWVIVTGDRGKKKKPGTGEKLPVVCAEFKVTYASFSRSFNQRTAFEKYRIILTVWEDLLTLTDEPPGTGYSIRPNSSGKPSVALWRPLPPATIQPDLPDMFDDGQS